MLKQLLGLAPTREADGSYSPSKVALKLATVKTTDFDNPDYPQVQGTRSKVLVIFTEQKDMENCVADINGDGNTNVLDLVEGILANFGDPCP